MDLVVQSHMGSVALLSACSENTVPCPSWPLTGTAPPPLTPHPHQSGVFVLATKPEPTSSPPKADRGTYGPIAGNMAALRFGWQSNQTARPWDLDAVGGCASLPACTTGPSGKETPSVSVSPAPWAWLLGSLWGVCRLWAWTPV